MRKTKINLSINREDYQTYESYFTILKISVLVLVFLFFILFLSFFIVFKNRFDQETVLKKQKQSYLLALSDKKGDEARLLYIQKKFTDLKTFLKEDASSLPYYSLLAKAIKESSQSSQIRSFEIDKSRTASFTISFTNFNELLEFFRFLESKVFLDNFEEISLKSFSVIGIDEKNESYEISFKGKFIKL